MKMVDLVIRDGLIYDGTGTDPIVADISVDAGLIVEIGQVTSCGREEIDARGFMVTPGWVDIHTHYDGQITWDSRVTPSSTLGVTTVVTGNCGVGFAPVRPQDRDTLIRLMEGVEDIPGAALHEGLSWDWESFPQFMDAIDRLPHDIDVAVQIPHGALRVYAMGKRGANREAATPEEARIMRNLTREAIEAGALGVSTTRTMVHRTVDGDLTPTFGAARNELAAIAQGLADAGWGVFQLVSDFSSIDEEFQLMRDLTKISGRPLSFSMVQQDQAPDQWRELMLRLDAAVAAGCPIKGQVAGRAIGLMLGLQGSAHPFISRSAFREITDLPLAAKVAAMRDPDFRARLISQAPQDSHPLINSLTGAYHKFFELGDPPNYEPDPKDSLGAKAQKLGINPDELVYEALLANEGRAFLYFPMLNYADGNLDNVRSMLTNPNTLSGLSDGGAHVGLVCDAGLPTFMLTHWCRDRTRGEKLDLAQVIRWQTKDTAEAVGLSDRGILRPGHLADINVIDFEHLCLRVPYMAYDLPTGARRLMQEAEGYVATIKTGKIISRSGQATGALPGQLVRGRKA